MIVSLTYLLAYNVYLLGHSSLLSAWILEYCVYFSSRICMVQCMSGF